MKKGFTLLELIVVVIILGILATLGFTQYARFIEKSRGAEAKAIFGTMRQVAAGYRLEHGNNLTGITNTDLGLGTTNTDIPSSCTQTHYFNYSTTSCTGDTCTFVADRCPSGGKPPQGPAGNITLAVNFSNGSDTWGGNGGY